MKQLIILLSVVTLILGCANKTEESGIEHSEGWTLIFRNDSAGNSVFGHKKDLINAVRMGYPIRIGFGGRRANDSTKSVEHIVDAHFLTISNSNEVFAQIKSIIGQRPDLESDTLKITFRENIKWTILVGTNGFSDRLSVDRFNDSIIGHRNRPTETSWFVDLSNINDYNTQEAWPLWEK